MVSLGISAVFYTWDQHQAAWVRMSLTDSQPDLRASKPELLSLLTEKDWPYISRPDKEKQMEISKMKADWKSKGQTFQAAGIDL